MKNLNSSRQNQTQHENMFYRRIKGDEIRNAIITRQLNIKPDSTMEERQLEWL